MIEPARAPERMAAEDPELAARLVLMTLPAAVGRISRTPLAYELTSRASAPGG